MPVKLQSSADAIDTYANWKWYERVISAYNDPLTDSAIRENLYETIKRHRKGYEKIVKVSDRVPMPKELECTACIKDKKSMGLMKHKRFKYARI